MRRSLNQEATKVIIESFFKEIEVPKRYYQYIIDGLVETSLRGIDSHGIRLVPHYIQTALIGRTKKKPVFSYKKTSATSGIFDADHGYGMTAGVLAMKEACKHAKKSGVGAVAVKNSSHFGAASVYGLLAARNDMIGLVFTDVDSLVFPFGAKKTYFGTNPICFTAPIDGEDPLCLDMATSRVSINKILSYKAAKKKLESGWAADDSGNPTVDPERAVSLLPTGKYKGYGLAMMVSVFSSLLTGMPFGPHIHPMYPLDKGHRYLGHFFMAIDIARFQPVAKFKKRLKQMVNELRKTTPIIPGNPVMVPGDPEKIVFEKRMKQGIPLTKEIRESYQNLAQELGMRINWNPHQSK